MHHFLSCISHAKDKGEIEVALYSKVMRLSAIKTEKRQGFLKLQLQPMQVEILKLECVLQNNKKYFLSLPSKYSQLRNLPLDKRLAVRLISLFT